MNRIAAALALALAGTWLLAAEGELPKTPEGGAGIAAKYPLDTGIGKDPRVIFFEDFESESWKDKWYQHNVRWRVNEVEAAKGEGMSFGGAASARLVVGAGKLYGSTLGSGKHPPGWNTMHLRWYVKFSDNYRGGKLGTTTALDEKTWVPGASGVAPTGTDKANAMICIQPKGLVEMYYYNLDQRGVWGSGGKPNVGAAPTLPNGRWHCIEVQGTMNVPGEKNSLMRLWVNGELKGEWTGFRWRSAESLKWNSWCFLIGSNENAPEEQFALIDNVVVATEYIGPMVKEAKKPEGGAKAAAEPVAVEPRMSDDEQKKALAEQEAGKLLQMARQAEQAGQRDVAKKLYGEVVSRFPGTEAADKAKGRLE